MLGCITGAIEGPEQVIGGADDQGWDGDLLKFIVRQRDVTVASFRSPCWRWLTGKILRSVSSTCACSSAPAFSTTSGGVARTVLTKVSRIVFVAS
jgi:hypothetical protein